MFTNIYLFTLCYHGSIWMVIGSLNGDDMPDLESLPTEEELDSLREMAQLQLEEAAG